jgi:hypothetical protein
MQPNPLEQLRDIHLPPDPGWWPPAIGWWLLALVIAFVCAAGIRAIYEYRRRRRPVRQARRLYERLSEHLRSGSLSGEAFTHECNELLKRLLVHGFGERDARGATDETWLAMLDERYGERAFTTGPGRLLGNERFRPDPEFATDELDALMQRFLKRVQP